MPLAVRPLSAPCLRWIGKTTSKGWQAYVEGAGDRGAVARRGRRTVDGVGQAGTPVELADGNGRLAGRPAVGREPEGRGVIRENRPRRRAPDARPARPRPAQRPDGHLARGAGRPPRDVRARRSAEVMANLRREAQRCRPESGRQRPCDRRTRRTRSHGPSEGWLLRLRQEPRDAGMAGLLEVGARHGGLPRRIGARPQMDAGYDETNPRQGQCKPRPWVTSSP